MLDRPPSQLNLQDIALFLDFDGTLVRFDRPDQSLPLVDARLKALMAELLGALDGALAVISGRALDTLEDLFAPIRLAAAGEHGSAWRIAPDAPRQSIDVSASLRAMSTGCQALLARFPGVRLEVKPHSFVLHFHSQATLRDELAQSVEQLCLPDSGMALLHAHGMLEIKSPDADKGVAISRFMGHAPFAGRMPIFVGDDVSDEDAFRVINALGGISVKVGTEPSHARFRLGDDGAVREWLGGLLRA
jgi:trehalose 6-phosphate phosphatase